MRPIEFLIIGAQKCGTTTLNDWLGQHPSIYVPEAKEIRYFADEDLYGNAERHLEPHYRRCTRNLRVGGAYVNLMFFPYVAERIERHNPNIKLVAMLRNPIDRAYSAYWHARRNGTERHDTFEAAIDAEPERLAGTFHERCDLTYLEHGRYASQLRPFIDRFGRDRVLVLLTDDLKRDARGTLHRVLRYLEVGDDATIDLTKNSNEASMPRFPTLHRLLVSPDAWYKRAVRRTVPDGIRNAYQRHVAPRLVAANLRPYGYPRMDGATRARLVEHFSPHNARLSELIDRDVSGWNL